jgi:hypothetical protein
MGMRQSCAKVAEICGAPLGDFSAVLHKMGPKDRRVKICVLTPYSYFA